MLTLCSLEQNFQVDKMKCQQLRQHIQNGINTHEVTTASFFQYSTTLRSWT